MATHGQIESHVSCRELQGSGLGELTEYENVSAMQGDLADQPCHALVGHLEQTALEISISPTSSSCRRA